MNNYKKLRNKFDRKECQEIMYEILTNNNDFELYNYRFIAKEAIDSIQCEELKSDLYMLGSFNAWFIAVILDMDIDVIKSMQESELNETIGKLVLRLDKLEAIQKAYASEDGYGHHFSSYDGHELEIDSHYYFRMN